MRKFVLCITIWQ